VTVSYAIKDGTCFYDAAILNFSKCDEDLMTYINPRLNTFFEVLVEFPEYSEVMHDFPILYLALKEAYWMAFKEENPSFGNLLYVSLPIDEENDTARSKMYKRARFEMISIDKC